MGNTGTGRLYVVATPIGNLGDLSPRACEVLRECRLIAAEDTRHTAQLLRHFAIQTPLISLHDHNEAARTVELIPQLLAGAAIALVSDAGTPGISDPGFTLVGAAVQAGIVVVALPGPCAAVAALSVAGLPNARFCFEGFLPARGAARRGRLEALLPEDRSLVFYESPHRIAETLADCVAVFGAARPAVIARELTKIHETVYRGTLAELYARALTDADLRRGEIVLIVAGAVPDPNAAGSGELDRVLRVLLAELPLRQAAQLAARITGTRDNEAYRRALELKDASSSQ